MLQGARAVRTRRAGVGRLACATVRTWVRIGIPGRAVDGRGLGDTGRRRQSTAQDGAARWMIRVAALSRRSGRERWRSARRGLTLQSRGPACDRRRDQGHRRRRAGERDVERGGDQRLMGSGDGEQLAERANAAIVIGFAERTWRQATRIERDLVRDMLRLVQLVQQRHADRDEEGEQER
jgi:hypothetical protein